MAEKDMSTDRGALVLATCFPRHIPDSVVPFMLYHVKGLARIYRSVKVVVPHSDEDDPSRERDSECHGNIEGESPLSSGIAYYLMNDLIQPQGDAYISGIFHVGPFTCMQEGVATAKIEGMVKELRKKKPER